MTTLLGQRSWRGEPGDYQTTVQEVDADDAAAIARCYRNLATWNKRDRNLAMAAWWASIAATRG